MATTTRAFLIGVGTTLTILTAGFGGGLLFAKNVMEPAPATKIRTAADRLPAVRVILPASAEAAKPPEALAAGTTEPAQPVSAPQPLAEQRPPAPTQTAQQAAEEDKRAERAARRKAEADEREHRKRIAERRARRDAARLASRLQQQEQEPQRRETSVLAFGEEQSRGPGLFGN